MAIQLTGIDVITGETELEFPKPPQIVTGQTATEVLRDLHTNMGEMSLDEIRALVLKRTSTGPGQFTWAMSSNKPKARIWDYRGTRLNEERVVVTSEQEASILGEIDKISGGKRLEVLEITYGLLKLRKS